MRLALVRHGDPTTTRGFVIALSSTMFDGGKHIALHGEEATCGNCKGVFKIIGTGDGVSENNRNAVVHGDKVLCPCGKNRVIAGADAGMFIHLNTGSDSTRASDSTNTARTNGVASHWISFALQERGSCAGLRCVAYFNDGSEEYGTFSADNTVRFERFDNDSACSRLEILPGDNANGSGSVTESLLLAIGE
ncbi:PAAR domain-containing protein [Paraburkholderia sp. UCT2]|uniref:PAAR domain-containing protein n=1 Tax=Paraburkholderia sp. UCT2 TaxID=2615208 RepID=UPI0016554E16|nr:PAAR domain-containing protein [Paraburkholderia sp. UCT2]MBC8729461.1 PAAR domain-containing protein [Paraburkholderia sp. UCT2]